MPVLDPTLLKDTALPKLDSTTRPALMVYVPAQLEAAVQALDQTQLKDTVMTRPVSMVKSATKVNAFPPTLVTLATVFHQAVSRATATKRPDDGEMSVTRENVLLLANHAHHHHHVPNVNHGFHLAQCAILCQSSSTLLKDVPYVLLQPPAPPLLPLLHMHQSLILQ